MFKKNNNDSITIKMQYAGIKQALNDLKNLDDFEWCDVGPILYNLMSILYCYNSIPCKCLKKRIKHIYNSSTSFLRQEISTLIAELETFLELNSSPEITIKDNSSHKI